MYPSGPPARTKRRFRGDHTTEGGTPCTSRSCIPARNRGAEEYARRWKAILAPRVRALPGFRAGYFFGDPAANTVHAIYLWDEKPVEELEEAMNDVRQQCRDSPSDQGGARTSRS